MNLKTVEWEMTELSVRMRKLARLHAQNVRTFIIQQAMKSRLSVNDVRAGCFDARAMLELCTINDTARIEQEKKLHERLMPRSQFAETWMKVMKAKMEGTSRK